MQDLIIQIFKKSDEKALSFINENPKEPEPEIIPVEENIETKKEEIVVDTNDKKKTDYNVFVKYYLDKLKKEDTTKTPNKILFQQTTQEWARLKKNPNELKVIMAQLKK